MLSFELRVEVRASPHQTWRNRCNKNIVARQLSLMNEPDHFGRATLAYAFNQTKYLGELRYYIRGDGSVENQLNRYVALDADLPDDPQAAEIVSTAHNDFTNAQKTSINSASRMKPIRAPIGK